MLNERERALVLVGIALRDEEWARDGMDPMEVSEEAFRSAGVELNQEFDARILKTLEAIVPERKA